MPTGYTAAIKDGISFEKFVWSCARAFGALVMMRDEPTGAPIPQRFEPSDYNAKRAAEARGELARLQAMSIEQVQAAAESAYSEAVQRHEKRTAERTELRNKYNAMLAKAVQWEPPTKDHEGLKEMMISQLRESIDWDCNDKYDQPPMKQDAMTWHNAQIAEARRSIAYHEKAQAEENERTEGRNAWLMALRESVPQQTA
jgi:hypothetical protein